MKKLLVTTAVVLSLGAGHAYAAEGDMGFFSRVKHFFTHLFHKDEVKTEEMKTDVMAPVPGTDMKKEEPKKEEPKKDDMKPMEPKKDEPVPAK